MQFWRSPKLAAAALVIGLASGSMAMACSSGRHSLEPTGAVSTPGASRTSGATRSATLTTRTAVQANLPGYTAATLPGTGDEQLDQFLDEIATADVQGLVSQLSLVPLRCGLAPTPDGPRCPAGSEPGAVIAAVAAQKCDAPIYLTKAEAEVALGQMLGGTVLVYAARHTEGDGITVTVTNETTASASDLVLVDAAIERMNPPCDRAPLTALESARQAYFDHPADFLLRPPR